MACQAPVVAVNFEEQPHTLDCMAPKSPSLRVVISIEAVKGRHRVEYGLLLGAITLHITVYRGVT